MKLLMIAAVALAAVAAPEGCKNNSQPACYKGRLEVKGICANYTIKVLEGNVAGVQASWTDEQTGKAYTNVFKPANTCNLPDTLKEGDSFYFVVDTAKQEPCNVCMAYYPTPEKQLAIRIVAGPCANN